MYREYKISLSQEFYSDVVYLSQYDDDYQVIFKVVNKYASANVNGLSAKFTGTRNDGLGFTFESTASGTSVSFDINTSLTAVAGTHTGEVVFYDANGLYFGSANVQIVVEPAAHPEGTIDADEEALRTLAQQVQDIVDSAKDEVEGEAERWATGTVDGEPVESTDPAYHNNAKYYSEQAQASAESIVVDSALSTSSTNAIQNKPVAEAIEELNANLNAVFSDVAKAALLACFEKVAWIDGNGQTYYNALESALFATAYPKITATFTPGGHVVYMDDALSTLIPYLVVKYFEDESDTGTVVSSDDYTLSGTLTEGQSVVRVAYGNVSTTFLLTVVDFYNQYSWSISSGLLEKVNAAGTARASSYNGEIWINYSTPGANAKKRRCIVTNRGKKPYIDYSTENDLAFYPIPIPKDAVKYTVSSNDASYYVGAECCIYDSINDTYASSETGGLHFVQGTGIATFEPLDNAFLLVVMKQNSAGSGEFDDNEPANVTVVFE